MVLGWRRLDGFYGCHALPRCFTCRAKRPFWRVGAVTRYASNPLSLLSICLIPIASYLYSWAVHSAYALRIGRAISKLIFSQYPWCLQFRVEAFRAGSLE